MIRDLMIDLCLGKFAIVSECNMDKYGRLLAKVSIQEDLAKCTDEGKGCGNLRHSLFFLEKKTDITKFLLNHGLGYEYDGGTKKDFSENDLNDMQDTCNKLRMLLRKQPVK